MRSDLLPDGLRIVPFYDRIELITAALRPSIRRCSKALCWSSCPLPVPGQCAQRADRDRHPVVTPLVTFIVMDQVGLTANLMSLGGLGRFAIGMMVDGSVVVVENVYRHLASNIRDARALFSRRLPVILHAVQEVGQPVIFGILIIILVFLPILSLQGMEGKMFQPLAYTIMIALVVSLVLSLTLSPVLCALMLKARNRGGHVPWCAGPSGSIFRRCTGRWAIASGCWPLRVALLGSQPVRCFHFSEENSFRS